MTETISAIVVNFNAGSWLRECVDSLLKCPLVADIIVVDNASVDNSLDAVKHLPRLRIIQNTTNIGFAAACNIGLNQTHADYVLFLNPDCSFASGTLAQILDCMRNEESIGMAGGILINTDGSEQAGARRAVPTPWRSFVRAFGLARFSDRWPRLFFDYHLHKQPLPDYTIEVEAISGACMMVRRVAMQEVGEWDEGYFLHCEDLDWCMRFRQKGWKIAFVPSAKINHALGVCGRSRPVFVEWHKHKGMIRFYKKFFRHQYPGVLMGLVVVGVWLRFGLVAAYYSAKRAGRALGFGRG